MPTPLENIDAAIANYTAILLDLSANPKVTYTAGGRTFDWTGYQKFITDALEKVVDLKKTLGGPYLIRARAVR